MKVPATEHQLEMEMAAGFITSPGPPDLVDTPGLPDLPVLAARKVSRDATACPAAPVSRVHLDTSL